MRWTRGDWCVSRTERRTATRGLSVGESKSGAFSAFADDYCFRFLPTDDCVHLSLIEKPLVDIEKIKDNFKYEYHFYVMLRIM